MLPLMQASEELRQLLQQSKHVLYGEDDHDPVPEHVAQLAQEFYQLQLIQHLLVVLPRLEFGVRMTAYASDTVTERHCTDIFSVVAAQDWCAASDRGVHLYAPDYCVARLSRVRT